jgi:TetR/AcrR family transcriptional repressor of mexJK operon
MSQTALAPASTRSDLQRRRILDGACRAFLAQGFGGASMDSVAAAAGVAKMTIYRYFRSKEELFAGVIGDMCDRVVDVGLAVAMARLPPREALGEFARRMVAILYAPETLGLHRIVVAESRRFPELGRLFYESGPAASIEMLAAYFRQHRRDPALRVADPQRAAEQFLSLLRGYEHMRALLGLERGPSARTREECIERAMQHVLH